MAITKDSPSAKVDPPGPLMMIMRPEETVSSLMSELRQSRPRRRRITIGGSDRRTNDEHGSTLSDHRAPNSVPQRPGPISSKHCTPEPDTELGFTPRQHITAKTQAVRRPYPPSSWKSTSTIESVTLDIGGASILDAPEKTAIRGQSAQRDVGRGGGKDNVILELLVDTVTAASGRAQSENRLAVDKPARTSSGRQYTIRSSRCAEPAGMDFSEASSDTSSPANDRIVTGKAPLPDPEVAYAQAFHYTTCPHVSPPKSRPLNVQPALVPHHKGLLWRRPLDVQGLRVDPGTAPPDIYVLGGACFDCDLSARRQAESGILETYTYKLENLTVQLSLLQHDIAAEHSGPSPNRENGALTAFTLPSTLELSTEATQGILEIEEQLSELVKKRDEDIRQVWSGFTARWGPGTVRIQRDESNSTPGRAESPLTTRTSSSTNSFGVPSANTTPEEVPAMASKISRGAIKPVSPSRQSSFTARTRASSIQGRYSDGSRNVTVESSVDSIKGRGRMLVDWIRPGRSESKAGGGKQAHRRKGSRQGSQADNGA
ncbi:hypothetical protein G647_00072 [Cladophialophora carrionii CBS 160.54]|uniref:Uncharacterized protein n=1 Tax=Cladophialophora carrionii CBS 160.54 TaxID=1279043 RepID=V9DMS8_9EURO|nr:uncharacterized protein G647_00072 [Cladophialophora carrionii CBS 160.54]ETI27623.1 hypothetical protein G647_00072 [Cladophialophora carrionii CBS 160.54]